MVLVLSYLPERQTDLDIETRKYEQPTQELSLFCKEQRETQVYKPILGVQLANIGVSGLPYK